MLMWWLNSSEHVFRTLDPTLCEGFRTPIRLQLVQGGCCAIHAVVQCAVPEEEQCCGSSREDGTCMSDLSSEGISRNTDVMKKRWICRSNVQ